MLKTKKKEDVPRLISISRAPRGKKKSVTVVTGLSTFGKSLNIKCYNRRNEWNFNDYKCVNFADIDLKIAAKFFGSKFACGSSVTGDDEIVIQGDVKDDLFEVIPEKWPQVSFIIK